jgi:chromosome segregation ATPase
MSSLLKLRQKQEDESVDGYVIDDETYNAIVNNLNVLNQNYNALVEAIRGLKQRMDNTDKQILALSQELENTQKMFTQASQSLTETAIRTVFREAATNLLKNVSQNISVNLEPLMSMVRDNLEASTRSIIEENQKLRQDLEQIINVVAQQQQMIKTLADKIEKMSKSSIPGLDELKSAIEEFKKTNEDLKKFQTTDVASRMDALMNDVKVIVPLIRALERKIEALDERVKRVESKFEEIEGAIEQLGGGEEEEG